MSKKRKRRLAGAVLITFIALAAVAAGTFWYVAKRPNVTDKGEDFALLIYPNSAYADVKQQLKDNDVLIDAATFDVFARLRDYDRLVKPGRYVLKKGMSNWDIVHKLRAGAQDEMKLVVPTKRLPEEVMEAVASQLMLQPGELKNYLRSDKFIDSLGFTHPTLMSLFIPNTYFVYWDVSPGKLIERFHSEYKNFWTEERKKKAKTLNLTPLQVSTLASIVQAETAKPDERPTVAGLYLNRLRKGWPLQADPTVIFAVGDFTIRRVLNKHLEYDSPYNTYKYKGLPPGPINNPDISSLDAVLNYHSHDYMFMCAKADFSGYHHFSKTTSEHIKYAKLYQQKLNEMNIR